MPTPDTTAESRAQQRYREREALRMTRTAGLTRTQALRFFARQRAHLQRQHLWEAYLIVSPRLQGTACPGDHDREASAYECPHCHWWVMARKRHPRL